MRIGPCLLLLLLLLTPYTAPEARSRHPDNKVVEFQRSGAWEIWCIRQGDTGEVICDLNIVVIYQPHPDFRAMIPRVYMAQSDEYWIEIEYELQTSFSAGFLESDSGARLELGNCDRPCILHRAEARRFVEFLKGSSSVSVNFRDYLIQEFEIDIDLKGFAEGLPLLKQMQSQY